jgi:hypothetical protein
MRKYLYTFSFLLSGFSFVIAQTWSPVGTGIKGTFTQLITCNNKLYANGIDSLNGKATHFAYWDGKTWHAADSNLPGQVTAMAIFKGRLYAGTAESHGAGAVYRLMYWNDTTWNKVSTLNGPINSLTTFKGNLVAGGKFSMAETTKAKFIAVWNDTAWKALGRGLSNNVRALAAYQNKLYAGGQFSEVDRWNGKFWEMVQGSKSSHMGGWIRSFYTFDNVLYACGEFNYLASWNNTDWIPAGSLNDAASALAECDGSLYIGGDFTSVPGSEYSNHIATYKPSTMAWNCLGGVMYSGGDCKPYTGTVWALAEYNGDMYVGGQFMIAGGKVINNIARLSVKTK